MFLNGSNWAQYIRITVVSAEGWTSMRAGLIRKLPLQVAQPPSESTRPLHAFLTCASPAIGAAVRGVRQPKLLRWILPWRRGLQRDGMACRGRTERPCGSSSRKGYRSPPTHGPARSTTGTSALGVPRANTARPRAGAPASIAPGARGARGANQARPRARHAMTVAMLERPAAGDNFVLAYLPSRRPLQRHCAAEGPGRRLFPRRSPGAQPRQPLSCGGAGPICEKLPSLATVRPRAPSREQVSQGMRRVGALRRHHDYAEQPRNMRGVRPGHPHTASSHLDPLCTMVRRSLSLAGPIQELGRPHVRSDLHAHE